MSEHVGDLQSLLRAQNAVPAHVVGHSYGAYLCLLVAVQHPHLVRSLVLIEPPVFPLFVSETPKPAELLRLFVAQPRVAMALINFMAQGMGPAQRSARRGDMDRAIRVFGKAVLGREAFGRLSAARWQQVLANNIRQEYLAGDFLPLATAALRQTRTPTLLVTGVRSPRLFHHIADRLGELLPNCQRVDIPHASHIVHEDNSEAFTAAVEAFLNDQTGAAVGTGS